MERIGGFLDATYPADTDLVGGAVVRDEEVEALDEGKEALDEADEGKDRPLVLDEAPEDIDEVDEFCGCAVSRINNLCSYLFRMYRSIRLSESSPLRGTGCLLESGL